MNTTEPVQIELCSDCVAIAAGCADELPEAIEWPYMDGYIVELGHLHTVDQCGQNVRDGWEDCPFEEASFSWYRCDACKRPQGGDRYPASMFTIIDSPSGIGD